MLSHDWAFLFASRAMMSGPGASMTAKKPIGKILLRQRALGPDELDRALTERGEGRLASRLARQGTITDVAALKALSEQLGVPGVDLSKSCVDLGALSILPRELAVEYRLLPLSEREDRLYVAMADPRDKTRIAELVLATGKRVHPFVALESALEVTIARAYETKSAGAPYYVAPNCPPACLADRGIDARGHLTGSAAGPEPLSLERGIPGFVVDDAMAEVGRADDVDEPSFEDVGRREPAPEGVSAEPEASRTILVAVADPDIRDLLVQLLSGRIVEAESGPHALEWLGRERPDLLVLDARLPELLGFEIARRIKRGERTRHVPVILVGAPSGAWQSSERIQRTLGIELVLEQPVRVAPVVSAAESYLRDRRRPRESEAARAREVELALRSGEEAYRRGDLDEAIAHLRRGVALDPFGFGIHFQLGLLSAKNGQIFDAIAALESAVATDDKHFPCLKSLAILHQKAGFRDLALESWERALKIAPDEAARQSIRERLLKLL